MAEYRAIDDLTRRFPETPLGTRWALVTDGVMGGLSRGRLRPEEVGGRPALRLTGEVSLENNGGFVQMALDLAPAGLLDAGGWRGIALDVAGNGEGYGLHLRTDAALRPWQSWRQGFGTGDWARVHLPFDGFAPHRIEAALDPARLRRLGIVAIGRAFSADLAVGGVWLWR
ncbi:MAG: CIA30 family protein [Alkalilacustris sp.]